MADAAGTWNIVLNTPLGQQNITLTIVADGSSISGTAASPMGQQEFSGGTVDGDRVNLSMDITQPMPMTVTFDGLIEGDTVNGTATLGAFGSSSFSGTRVV
jgi:aerobic carbon-monoxide dehydrogenase large subunit